MGTTPDDRVPAASVAHLQGGRLFWALIEDAWPDSEEPEMMKKLVHATPGQRAIASITLFMREVDNGGLEQFFWNSSGDVGDEVIRGFERLGSPDRAEIVRKALTFFGIFGRTPEQRVRREVLSSTPRDAQRAFFDALNSQLYHEERLFPLFQKYVDVHPEEFFKDLRDS